jgi:hypothetical protein
MPQQESITAFEGQLRGHRVRSATLHAKAHTVHLTLSDGHKAVVAVPASQQQQLLNQASADGVIVKTSTTTATSHTRRYIGAAVVLVLIALAVAGLVLFRRKRRLR